MEAIKNIIAKHHLGKCDEIEKAILSCYYDGSPGQARRAAEQYAQHGVEPTGGNVAAICNCHSSYGIHSDWCPAKPISR